MASSSKGFCVHITFDASHALGLVTSLERVNIYNAKGSSSRISLLGNVNAFLTSL